MKYNIKFFCFMLLFFEAILITGCASTSKSYRDSEGVLKTDTRSTVGVQK